MKHYKKICLIAGLAGILSVTGCSKPASTVPDSNAGESRESVSVDGESVAESTTEPAEKADYSELIAEADLLAAGYDFDGAIALLKEVDGYGSVDALTKAIAGYEEEQSAMVLWPDNTQVPHVFFHTLVPNTDLAFDGDYREDGYNQVMTTVDEFNKIIQQMYDNGWVLVTPYQLYKMEEVTEDVVVSEEYTDENGTVVPAVTEKQTVTKMVKQDIYLPEGKKPFVLSQDDVCYYEYMEGDGFASKLLIGEDGKVTNEYILEDGTVTYGSYDVLPLLEDFLEEHPDFSYQGAKGILALTGYNGILGYRTSDYTYGPGTEKENKNIEADKKAAAEVAEAIKAQGWLFASHSWGHRDYSSSKWETFKTDADLWQEEVAPLIGGTDIIIFPFGSDVGSWRGYEGERYEYLKNQGFDYYCNVDGSTLYWVQVTKDYFRQGRMNLDGYRMYQDLYNGADKLSPLFDVESVFDPARPLPVPDM